MMTDQENSIQNQPLLLVQGLTKNFGGLKAINNVNLRVEKGVVYSIIGPNGAGKTSLFNLIYGVFPPDTGSIHFQGKDITNLRSHQISHLGIGRSYQGYNLFTHLSVLENVRIGCQSRGKYNFSFFSDAQKYREPAEKARGILKTVGLLALQDHYPHELSHGDQRILEIAIALACDPVLLLLDEPTSGLAPGETMRMIELIESFRENFTILLIEHKMMVVMSVSKKIIVLQQGAVIAEGTPEEIKENEKVHEAYLGGYRESDLRS
jgi:branched-chain amino acid transport system ATP-binding protein